MKKILALTVGAVVFAVLFAVISVAMGFLMTYLISTGGSIYMLLGLAVFAAAAFGYAVLINLSKKFFINKMEILPLSFYITAFFPSLAIAGVFLGVTLQRAGSGYYADTFFGDIDKSIDLFFSASYFAFTVITAICLGFINLYRRKKAKLDRQVEEYISEHKS